MEIWENFQTILVQCTVLIITVDAFLWLLLHVCVLTSGLLLRTVTQHLSQLSTKPDWPLMLGVYLLVVDVQFMHNQNVLHEWVWRSRQQVIKNLLAALQAQLKLTVSIGKKHAAINFKTWQEKIHQYNLTYTLTMAWSIKSILFWTNTIGIPPHSSSTCKGMMQNMYDHERALHVCSTCTAALLMASYLSLLSYTLQFWLVAATNGFHLK